MRYVIAYTQCKLMRLRDDLKGVTAMEYGLLAATTVVVGLAAIAAIGGQIAGVFASISAALPAA